MHKKLQCVTLHSLFTTSVILNPKIIITIFFSHQISSSKNIHAIKNSLTENINTHILNCAIFSVEISLPVIHLVSSVRVHVVGVVVLHLGNSVSGLRWSGIFVQVVIVLSVEASLWFSTACNLRNAFANMFVIGSTICVGPPPNMRILCAARHNTYKYQTRSLLPYYDFIL